MFLFNIPCVEPPCPCQFKWFREAFLRCVRSPNLFVQHSICWAPLSLSVATSCFLIILCCTKSSTFLSFFFVTTNVFVQYSMCCQHCWAPLSLSVATSWSLPLIGTPPASLRTSPAFTLLFNLLTPDRNTDKDRNTNTNTDTNTFLCNLGSIRLRVAKSCKRDR